MMLLEHKTALVTGGSRGIGRAIALSFARAGATVCVSYQKNEKKAQEVLEELKKISSQGHCLTRFDVASYDAVEAGIAACAEKLKTLDILVNNAGMAKDNLLLRMKVSEWDEVIATNLKGVFNCSKVASKIMLKKRKGRIINIASLSGEMGNPGQTNYSASKAGVMGFTKSLAKELASRSITVNAVSPGFIETEMTTAMPNKEVLCQNIPMGRFGTCEEVAHLVLFLASDKASYITGQIMGVNGGLYM